MDILRVLESGFILKTSPDHKGSVMSIEISQTNNNIFVIGSTDLNARVWDIRIGNFVQNHVGHESDTNSVFLFPMEMPLAPDQTTPPVCCSIQDYMGR